MTVYDKTRRGIFRENRDRDRTTLELTLLQLETDRQFCFRDTAPLCTESRYAPETRDHVVRVRMRGGALTLALYMYNVQSVSTVLRYARHSLVPC